MVNIAAYMVNVRAISDLVRDRGQSVVVTCSAWATALRQRGIVSIKRALRMVVAQRHSSGKSSTSGSWAGNISRKLSGNGEMASAAARWRWQRQTVIKSIMAGAARSIKNAAYQAIARISKQWRHGRSRRMKTPWCEMVSREAALAAEGAKMNMFYLQ